MLKLIHKEFNLKLFGNKSILLRSIFNLSRFRLTDPRQSTCLDAASKSQ